MHWLAHVLGLDSASGGWYLGWSGFGSDITELAIVGALLAAWHRVNCHVKGCWRVGRQHVEGSTFVVCRRHHPLPAPTHAHILALHRRHRQRRSQASGETCERLYDHERDGL